MTPPSSETLSESVERSNDNDATQELWERFNIDHGNPELRNALVGKYMSIVGLIAKRVRAILPDSAELDDLVSDGAIGLMGAIDAFDPTRGVKFETYCVLRIRGAMLDRQRTMDWVPRLVRSKQSEIRRCLVSLTTKMGRAPTEEEFARHMGLPESAFLALTRNIRVPLVTSLQNNLSKADSSNDVTAADSIAPQKGAGSGAKILQEEWWSLAMQGMNRQERLVIILYYREEMTLGDIGKHLGVSGTQVSHMHNQLMLRLRDRFPSLAECKDGERNKMKDAMTESFYQGLRDFFGHQMNGGIAASPETPITSA